MLFRSVLTARPRAPLLYSRITLVHYAYTHTLYFFADKALCATRAMEIMTMALSLSANAHRYTWRAKIVLVLFISGIKVLACSHHYALLSVYVGVLLCNLKRMRFHRYLPTVIYYLCRDNVSKQYINDQRGGY